MSAQDAVPEPPWLRERPRRTAPRTPLSRDAIVDAALRVVDREGVEGVSMRRVAEELDTGPSSLYWHVRNKDELLNLVFDRVVGEIELPPLDTSRWKEQVKESAREARRVMSRHRDIARVSLGQIPIGPNLIRFVEWQLALLRGAGIPDRAAAYAGDLFGLYLGAFAYEETLGLGSPTGEELPPHEVLAMIRDYFASLPPDRFPNTVALVDELMAGGPDERFEFGLDVLVRGLAAQAESS
jgi:AcrR family transcriptional regulator